jgi:hypothetical protein
VTRRDRALALLSVLPPEPTLADVAAVQRARNELDLLLAELWRGCPVLPGAGYHGGLTRRAEPMRVTDLEDTHD